MKLEILIECYQRLFDCKNGSSVISNKELFPFPIFAITSFSEAYL